MPLRRTLGLGWNNSLSGAFGKFVEEKQADKSAMRTINRRLRFPKGTTKGDDVSWLLEVCGDDYQPVMRKP